MKNTKNCTPLEGTSASRVEKNGNQTHKTCTGRLKQSSAKGSAHKIVGDMSYTPGRSYISSPTTLDRITISDIFKESFKMDAIRSFLDIGPSPLSSERIPRAGILPELARSE